MQIWSPVGHKFCLNLPLSTIVTIVETQMIVTCGIVQFAWNAAFSQLCLLDERGIFLWNFEPVTPSQCRRQPCPMSPAKRRSPRGQSRCDQAQSLASVAKSEGSLRSHNCPQEPEQWTQSVSRRPCDTSPSTSFGGDGDVHDLLYANFKNTIVQDVDFLTSFANFSPFLIMRYPMLYR